MPLQVNIDAARQHSDAARTAVVGLSLEEGAAAPVAAMGTTNMNLFAAAFGECAAVPAAGGVGGWGHPRRLRVEHMAGRGGRGGRSRGGRGGRGRGGRGIGGRSGNSPGRGEGAIHVVALPTAPVPIATPVAMTNSFLHQLLNPQTHTILQAAALPPTPAAIPPSLLWRD